MIPQPAIPGERTSAGFLNWCREQLLYGNGLYGGSIQSFGTHQIQIGNSSKAIASARASEAMEEWSVFGVIEDAAEPYLRAVKASDSSNSSLYTNGKMPVVQDQEFRPIPLNEYNVYRLLVESGNPPAVGDFATPAADEYTIEKGGTRFLCLVPAAAEGWALCLALPASSSQQALGFVKDNDIAAQSPGVVELYDYNNIPNGTEVNVFNPHDVTFYKENTIPDEEHPADRVILFEVLGWPLPLIFPFMLSECEELDPLYSSEDI